MLDAKSMKTPMHTSKEFIKGGNGKKVYRTIYYCMIDSLLYLTSSRPNIMNNACLCIRFQSNPRKISLKSCQKDLLVPCEVHSLQTNIILGEVFHWRFQNLK